MVITTTCAQRMELSMIFKVVDLEDRSMTYSLIFPLKEFMALESISLYDLYTRLLPCLQINECQLMIENQMKVKCLLYFTENLVEKFDDLTKNGNLSPGQKDNNNYWSATYNKLHPFLTVKTLLDIKRSKAEPASANLKRKKKESSDSLSSSENSIDDLINYKNDMSRLDIFAIKIQRSFRGLITRRKYKEMHLRESIVVFKKSFLQHDFESVSCTILKRLATQEYTIYGYNYDFKYYFRPETFVTDFEQLAKYKKTRTEDDYFEEVFQNTYFDPETKTLYFKDFLIEEPAKLTSLKREDHSEVEKRKAERFLVRLMKKDSRSHLHEKIVPHFEQRYKMVGKRTFPMEGTQIAILVVSANLVLHWSQFWAHKNSCL